MPSSRKPDSKSTLDNANRHEKESKFDDHIVQETKAMKTADVGKSEEKASPRFTASTSDMMDIEALYDCPEERHLTRVKKEAKMVLPRSSSIELFHMTLSEDLDRLKQMITKLSPLDLLGIADMNGRTIYHYGALLKNKLVQQMIFQHVKSYYDTQLEKEMQALMRQKEQMNMCDESMQILNRSCLPVSVFNSDAQSKDWIPPRAQELHDETSRQKCSDWTKICSRKDEHGRTFLHYSATTAAAFPVQNDEEFYRVVRSQPCLLSFKDMFQKMALHYALEAGNVQQVKWYFQMGIQVTHADVNSLLSFNVSTAMEHVLLGHLEALGIHKNDEFSAVVDCCDSGIKTFALAKLQRLTDTFTGYLHLLPLHRAAMYGNLHAVEILLDEGADPNVRDANLWTPLHYCAQKATADHLSIAWLLMESLKPVDVNATSCQGRSPLHIAVQSKSHSEVDNFPSRDSEDRLAFVSFLLYECKADLNLKDERGSTPLLLATRNGYVNVVEFLLRAECEPLATGDNKWNPLHFAAIRGDPCLLKFLLSWDADVRLWIDSPGIQGKKPVDLARNDDIRQLFRNLWTECYDGHVEHVRSLLSQKPHQVCGYVDVMDTTAQTQRTPLHLAIQGYADLIQSPATFNTLISSRVKAGEMKKTASSRYFETVVLLLQAGAEICASDNWGITPLMLATSIKDAILMETLLDEISQNDDLIRADRNGNTALHYSYAFCQAQISTMLEDRTDEDTTIDNKEGKSPFEMTGYRDKIFPKDYRAFLQRHKHLTKRQQSCK